MAELEVAAGQHERQRAMERWISHVLRAGVVAAGAIVLLGLILFLVDGPGAGEPGSRAELTRNGGQAITTGLRQVIAGAGAGRSAGVIQLGLLVLLLTPIVRVAMTFLLFTRQRDWVFAAITAAVLTILALGLAGVGG